MESPERRLARKLCAASVSEQARVGLEYAYKTYCSEDAEIGEFWLDLANLILNRE